MTKYRWSFLGLIVSIILFLVFLISPLIKFVNVSKFIPTEPGPLPPIELFINPLDKYIISAEEIVEAYEAKRDYYEWYDNVPKKFNWSALSEFGKSFYHWNLFWIPIIILSVLTVNYKKEP